MTDWYGTVLAECVCPKCGQIFRANINADYYSDPHAWRRGGYLVIQCLDCRHSPIRRRDYRTGETAKKNVQTDMYSMGRDLAHAMSPEVWAKVETELKEGHDG